MKAIYVAAILILTGGGVFAEQSTAQSSVPLTSYPLDGVITVHSTGTFENILYPSPLSIENNEILPMGFERKSRSKGEPEPIIAFSVNNVSRKEALNLLVSKDRGYAWEISDGILNIFPKEEGSKTNSKSVLSERLPEFSVTNANLWEALDALVREAGKQQIKLVRAPRLPAAFSQASSLPRSSYHLVNITIRECLNAIVRADLRNGLATHWSATASDDGMVILLPPSKQHMRLLQGSSDAAREQRMQQSIGDQEAEMRHQGFRKRADGMWVKDEKTNIQSPAPNPPKPPSDGKSNGPASPGQ